MKLFLEVDFAKGNGGIRWEGVTTRRIRGVVGSVAAVLAAVAFVMARHLW